MFKYILVLLSVSLFAKDIYLIDTQKCKVYFNDKNTSQIFIQDICELRNKNTVIDKIKTTYEHQPRPKLYSFISSSKPIKVNYYGKKLQAYKLNDSLRTRTLLTTPLYATLRYRDRKFTYYGYIHKDNLIILDNYDEGLDKKQLRIINSIPRDITVTQISTPTTYAYLLTKELVKDKKIDIKTNEWENILYNASSYDDVIKHYKDINGFSDDDNYLIDFLSNKDFLTYFTFEQKAKIMLSIQKNIDKKYRMLVFNIYGIMKNRYSFKDNVKNIEYQIAALKILNNNYNTYKSLYINNNKNELIAHFQPDLYGESMISTFKKSIKDKKLIDTYTKEMRKLYTHAREDITYYNIQTIIGALSSDDYKHVHPYLQNIYKQKLSKKGIVKYHLGLMNLDERTYINVEINIDISKTQNILNALKKDGKELKFYNTKYTKKFNIKMTKDEIVKKLLSIYNLKLTDVEIVKSSVAIGDKTY